MEITLTIEGIPSHHRRFIVARLLFGELRYYSSYTSEKKALSVVEKLEGALVVDTRSD